MASSATVQLVSLFRNNSGTVLSSGSQTTVTLPECMIEVEMNRNGESMNPTLESFAEAQHTITVNSLAIQTDPVTSDKFVQVKHNIAGNVSKAGTGDGTVAGFVGNRVYITGHTSGTYNITYTPGSSLIAGEHRAAQVAFRLTGEMNAVEAGSSANMLTKYANLFQMFNRGDQVMFHYNRLEATAAFICTFQSAKFVEPAGEPNHIKYILVLTMAIHRLDNTNAT